MEASKSSAGFLLLLGVVIGLVSCSEAYVFYVGWRNGWGLNPSEDYGRWAGRNRFQVNDSFVFKYQKGNDSVLVVKKEDYDSCNLTNPIQRFDDGNSVFKLDRSGPFYFISGTGDRCQKGEKLMIVVLAVRNKTPTQPPTSPAPSLPPSPTPSTEPPTSSPSPSPSIHVPSPSASSPSPSPSIQVPSPSTSSPSPSPSPSIQVPSPSTSPPSPSPSIHVPSPSSSPVSSPPPSSPSPSGSPSPNSPGFERGPAPAPSPTQNSSPSTSPSAVLSGVSFGLVALVLGFAFIN